MSMNINHPYHLVTYSPWPSVAATSIMIAMIGFISFSYEFNEKLMITVTMILMLTIIQWWRDVIRESTFQGWHTSEVLTGLRWGMILFIISEVFFFVSFLLSLAPYVQWT